MDTQSLLREIDAEIAKFQRARAALVAIDSTTPKKRRGRPPKTTLPVAKAPQKRRPMSAAAREKIAAAQRKRWAKQKGSKKSS